MTRIAVTLAVAFAWAACSSNASAPIARPDAAGTGGTADANPGGQTGAGGMVGTGGTTATGGVASTPTAGTVGRGGSQGTGGLSGSGGSARGTGGGAGNALDAGGTGGTAGTVGTGGTGGGIDAGIDAQEAGGSDTGRDGLPNDTRPAIADAPAAEANTNTALTVYVAGDSTVSTYTNSAIHQGGWGQFLQDSFITNAKIVNKAVGGMTARHFIEAGYLDQILAVIKAGDYLLVQFGTNDSNKTATYTLAGSTTEIPYYLDAQTDFKTYLAKYVDGAKAKGATTIFVTPPPRHSCNAGETGVRNGLSDYAAAMNQLGPTLGTPVVDSNAMIIDYLANVTCESSGSTFYLVKADGTTDGTHFQETGAKIIAGLIAKGRTGLSTLNLPLSAYVK